MAGLGNSLVTPDRLGPETAAKVRVTRHLFLIFDADGDEEMSNVSCIIPGVTGSTGMETAEVIKKSGGDRPAGCSHRHRFSGSAGH